MVLVQWLPYDSPVMAVLRAEEDAEKAPRKPTTERLRQRARELAEQRAKEVPSD